MEKVPLTIIGGGVIGLAIANELSSSFPEIALFEKNKDFGLEQSTRNAGVIHSGLYYPGLKKKLCLEGNKLLYQFCQEQDIPCSQIGKLIVALNQEEDLSLDQLLEEELNLGVELKKISGEKVKQIEPNLNVYSALLSPSTGVIDSSIYLKKLVNLAKSNGIELFKESKIEVIASEPGGFTLKVKTPQEEYEFKTEILINSAGLYADQLAKQVNPDFPYEIIPVKGEFYKFNQQNSRLEVKTNIYPLPYEYTYQGITTYSLGVHLTPLFALNGKPGKEINVGPAVKPINSRTDYALNIFDQDFFYREIKSFFPNIAPDDLQPNYAGILAEIKNYHDFIIEKDQNYPQCINLVGIESPGLTSSLAIARYVKNLLT